LEKEKEEEAAAAAEKSESHEKEKWDFFKKFLFNKRKGENFEI
jgi:hypothetical protein